MFDALSSPSLHGSALIPEIRVSTLPDIIEGEPIVTTHTDAVAHTSASTRGNGSTYREIVTTVPNEGQDLFTYEREDELGMYSVVQPGQPIGNRPSPSHSVQPSLSAVGVHASIPLPGEQDNNETVTAGARRPSKLTIDTANLGR
jgi:hypothetical protein